MAIIKCPECGKSVSDKAKTCPNCGFAVSDATNNLIRIKIDRYPDGVYPDISIYDADSCRLLTTVRTGCVAEIRSNKEIKIYFKGLSGVPMHFANVSPQNGGKYRAVWGPGLFSAKIIDCFRVDGLDF